MIKIYLYGAFSKWIYSDALYSTSPVDFGQIQFTMLSLNEILQVPLI